jgi:hypothetical protein
VLPFLFLNFAGPVSRAVTVEKKFKIGSLVSLMALLASEGEIASKRSKSICSMAFQGRSVRLLESHTTIALATFDATRPKAREVLAVRVKALR